MEKISDELKKELSNAFAAYAHVLYSAVYNCDIPNEFAAFKGIDIEDAHRRLQLLQDFYKSLEERNRW